MKIKTLLIILTSVLIYLNAHGQMMNKLNIAFEKPVGFEFYRGYNIIDLYQDQKSILFIARVQDGQASSSLNLFKVDLNSDSLELKKLPINITGIKISNAFFASMNDNFLIIKAEGYVEENIQMTNEIDTFYLNYNASDETFKIIDSIENDVNLSPVNTAHENDTDILTLFSDDFVKKNLIANFYDENFGLIILNVNYMDIVSLPPYSFRNHKYAQTIVIARYVKSNTPLLTINSFSGDGTMVINEQINLFKTEHQKTITLNYSAHNLIGNISDLKVMFSKNPESEKEFEVNINSINENTINFELKNEISDGDYFLRIKKINGKIITYSLPVTVNVKNEYYSIFIKQKKVAWANVFLLSGLLLVFIWLALITFIPTLTDYNFNVFKKLLIHQEYTTLWQWVISLVVLTPWLGFMSLIVKNINQCLKFING